MRFIFFIILLLIVGCGVSSDPKIKLDLGHRMTSAITTADEYAKLDGSWKGRCTTDREITQEGYIFGQLCGDDQIDMTNHMIHLKFPANYFNHAVLREVANCNDRDGWCQCEHENDALKCKALFPRNGQCEITVNARLINTISETTSAGIFGGPYSVNYLTFDNAIMQVTYLDPAVEQAEAPTTDAPGGSHLFLSDAEAAKYHCQRIQKLLEVEIKKAKLEYSIIENSLRLHPENESSLLFFRML